MRTPYPHARLAAHALAAGLADLATWLAEHRDDVDALIAWPPPPKRSGVYSAPERDRLFRWVGELPEVRELVVEAEAQHARLVRAFGDDYERLLDEWDSFTSPSPRVRAHALGEELRDDLRVQWAKAGTRDHAWLSAWSARALDRHIGPLRARMAVLEDPQLYDPHTPLAWFVEHAAELGQIGEHALVRLHRIHLGAGDVPSWHDLQERRATAADVQRAQARLEAVERGADERRRAEDYNTWAVVDQAFARVGTDTDAQTLTAALPHPGSHVELRERTPAGGDVQRWFARVRIGTKTLHGPAARSRWGALPALQALARAVMSLPDDVGDSWQGAVQGLRRELAEPALRSNPSAPAAAGVGSLGNLAAIAAFPALAQWAWAHDAEVGAVIAGQARWNATYRTNWTTEADAGAETYTRIDRGYASLEDLVALRAPEQPVGAMLPGFREFWRRDLLRAAGDWRETTGAHSPAAWRALVDAVRAGGLREPVVVHRTTEGDVLVVEGIERVYAGLEAGQTQAPVTIRYERGSERYGLIADPATGAWDPFPVGRAVRWWDVRGAARGWIEGRVIARNYPGGFLPETAYTVRSPELERDVLAFARDLRLAPRPAQLERTNPPTEHVPVRLVALARRHGMGDVGRWLAENAGEIADLVPALKRNPARLARVGFDAKGRDLLIRATDERARLLGRARTLALEGAHVEPAGTVVGRIVHSGGAPPAPVARWRAIAGAPGQWLAAEDPGTPGRVYVIASPAARDRARLTSTPLRYNRVSAPDVVGEALFDAEGRRYSVYYQVVEAALDGSTLATSHQPDDFEQWTPGYPREFQTRDLGSPEEGAKIRSIARNMDPERLLGRNLDATLGPPVAWEGPDERLYVLGGNGRALAILIAPEEQYERYQAAGRKEWVCWPAFPARQGFRWILVRVVAGASRDEAARLAAASQMSTAAEEGRLGKAIGLVRSLRLDLSQLAPITWSEPITAANATEFMRENRAFVDQVLAQVDPAKRQLYLNDSDKLGPLMESVLLGFLPPALQRAGLFSEPKTEDALLGAMPTLVTLRSQVEAGAVFPAFDLLSALPSAVGVFEFLRRRRMSFRAFDELLEGELRTARLGDVERLSDTPDLSLALAGSLYNASRRAAPAQVMSDFLRAYLQEALRYDPRQTSLFGPVTHPDPARVLADLVGGMRLPTRQRENPRRAGVLWLEFDRAYFPTASDTRDWAKEHRYHPGVPRATETGWRVDQSSSPAASAERRVPVGDGVVAAL